MQYVVARLGLRSVALVGAAFLLTSCVDSVQPTAPSPERPQFTVVTAQTLMARFVSLGTSNSEGVQSAGINAAGQRSAWPAQLAARAGVPYQVPAVQDPGCSPPLLPPLATDLLLVGAFGDDLVGAVMTTCSPLQSGVTLPASNLAISGAHARDALYSTIASEALLSAQKAELYKRVLLPGQTQVTAMLSEHPTFVSVELAANEVLPASTGLITAMTPYAKWQPVYDAVLDSVKKTGAAALLVGVPNNAANFPSIRKAREFFNQWPSLLALGISVSINCYWSSNYLFIPGYLLTLLSKTPTTATCADVPGTQDYVLAPSDVSAINSLMATMNAHMQAQATANGWAYFSLSSLYDLPKPSFSISNVLFSSTPFGANISLDGVHPSAQGQSILASAAAQAINAKYGVTIP